MRAGSDLLGRWRSAPGDPRRGVPAALEEAWRKVAGEVVAGCSRPIALNPRGTLTVAVADAIWSQEISARSEDLVAGLRATPGGAEVRSLRTRVADQVFSGFTKEPTPHRPPPPDESALRAGRRVAERISDPTVRDAVARAAAAGLSPRDPDT